ncbi:hypothetical protein M8C21_022647, partial [Ambrosia artemisiifolia]
MKQKRDCISSLSKKKEESLQWRDIETTSFRLDPRKFTLMNNWILKFPKLPIKLVAATYVLFRDDHAMKLPYFIAIAGFVCGLFAICIPHLSALRIWLGFSTFFSLVYIVVAFALSLRDGVRAPPRDYDIPGSDISRVFTTIGASASLVFAFNTGMLPEIQATVKQPVVGNMMKALYFQFTVGVLPLYAVAFMGYWAYGNDSSAYLLSSVSGPVWVKTFANISAFLQTVIALHIFASPMYEYLDTKHGIKGSALAIKNLSFRIMVRGGYLAVTTLLAAALPFIGDFMSLTGAIRSLLAETRGTRGGAGGGFRQGVVRGGGLRQEWRMVVGGRRSEEERRRRLEVGGGEEQQGGEDEQE